MGSKYLATEPVYGACSFSAADLDGKTLNWKLPSPGEIDRAPSSEMLCSEQNGQVSVAIRDSVEGPHRDSDGKPIMIKVFGLWLTQEGLNLLQTSASGPSDFEALAPELV